VLQGDCKTVMESLPEKHFQMCVTSPPYFALRSYLPADHPDKPLEIGSEPTIEEFVATMVEVFRGVWRVLRDDGCCFINLGDSYCNAGSRNQGTGLDGKRRGGMGDTNGTWADAKDKYGDMRHKLRNEGVKHKDLIGIPWRVALALQAEGWYLRDAICWQKPAPMPGSQRDRCTSSYEFLFQLTKKPACYWDMEAVREGTSRVLKGSFRVGNRTCYNNQAASRGVGDCSETVDNVGRIPRNAQRFEWVEEDVRALLEYMNATPACPNILKIASEGFPGSHFATFPRALPEWTIKAATSEKGCCPECGTPWGRVVDRTAATPGQEPGYTRDCTKRNDGERAGRWTDASTRTIGWTSGCEHGYEDLPDCPLNPVPCRILDPFGGAGTTGLAAIGLQRRCTLIELAEDYCDQIVARLRNGLYAKTQKRDDLPGQQTLFPLIGGVK